MVAKWVQDAMNTAIKKVRFETARLSLEKEYPFRNDTEQIRDATKLYVETWNVPLLEAVRDGKRDVAECFIP